METAGRIELLFGAASTIRLSHDVGIRVSSKRVLPSIYYLFIISVVHRVHTKNEK